MSLVVHPRFAENHWIYFVYNKPVDEKGAAIVVARATLDDDAHDRSSRHRRQR